ncbi:MAG: hypothetical protein KGV59_04200 [Tenacibaculum sp.]|nr:hypothetical protein [Tenacibaculum sp.]
MTQRKTHKKQMNVQDIAEVLMQQIEELKLIENKASQTIKNALLHIQAQHNQKIDVDPTNFKKVGDEFLTKFKEPQAEYLLLIKETMKRVAEEQNELNEETRKLNSQLYEIQTEVKKLSKVGFGRLPNYLVAVLLVILVVMILWSLKLHQ